jgi:hypothetical protein
LKVSKGNYKSEGTIDGCETEGSRGKTPGKA